MEELLTKAQKISGIKYDISSYSDIVQAIHIVQQEMGIAGTTSQEAAGTITGSVASMKSAWNNLVQGMANENADMGTLIDNFVNSAEGAFTNLMPTIEKALIGIGSFVEQMVPVIGEKLPSFFEKLVPPLIKAATSLVNSLIKALPSIISSLASGLASGIRSLAQGISETLPELGTTLLDGLTSLINQIPELFPILLEQGIQFLTTFANGISETLPTLIPQIIDVILQMAMTLTDAENLKNIIDAAFKIIQALAEGIIAAIPELLAKLPIILTNLVQGLYYFQSKIWTVGFELLVKLCQGILDAIPKIVEAVPEIINNFIEGISTFFGDLFDIGLDVIGYVADGIGEAIDAALTWGGDLIDNFVTGIKNGIGKVIDAVGDVASAVADFLGFSEPDEGPLSNFHTYAPDMIDLFTEGIEDNIGEIDKVFNANLKIPDMPTMDIASNGGGITIPVYIGQERIDEVIVNSLDMQNYRVGGR